MLKREAAELNDAVDSSWHQLYLGENLDRKLFVNCQTGICSLDTLRRKRNCKGGILADEMGM